MALSNIVLLKTELEAAAYAVADREKDSKNYNLEKPGGQPYQQHTLVSLIQAKGYREYRTFRLFWISDPVANGMMRVVGYPNKSHPDLIPILNDFVERPKKKLHEIDSRFWEFHQTRAKPVYEHLAHSRLTMKVIAGRMMESVLAPGVPFHTGGRVEARIYPADRPMTEVLRDLEFYALGYYAPLSYETTGKGEYRIDDGHEADPNNPHSFRHIHVYHQVRSYHTTMRLST